MIRSTRGWGLFGRLNPHTTHGIFSIAATVATGVGAAASAASAIHGLTSSDSGTGVSPNGDAPGYVPPTVTAEQANAANARLMKAINASIRRQNRYQRRLEHKRHLEARNDIDWFRGQIDRAAEAADPYIKERRKWMAKMELLMNSPEDFLRQSPEMKAQMEGGLEALTSSFASKGLLGSGNMVIEAQRLGQREGSAQLGKDWERLAKLSGLMDANLGAASDIMAGSRVPFLGDYRPQFDSEKFHPAQFEEGQQYETYQPGPPDRVRQAFVDLAGSAGLVGPELRRIQKMTDRG